MSQPDAVERWSALSHTDLVEEVYRLVRRHDDDAERWWNVVRDHPVLAARVRGILSALERQSAEYRDARMWRLWIDQARRVLTASSATSVQARPADPDPEPAIEAEDETLGVTRVSNTHRASPAQVTFRAPGQ
jgi:hypothetical protein